MGKSNTNNRFQPFDYLLDLPVGVCVVKADFTVLYWNRCLQEWTGYSIDQVEGEQVFRLFPGLGDESNWTLLQYVIDTGESIRKASDPPVCVFEPEGDSQQSVQLQLETVSRITGEEESDCDLLLSFQSPPAVKSASGPVNDSSPASGMDVTSGMRGAADPDDPAARSRDGGGRNKASHASRPKEQEVLGIISHDMRNPLNNIIGLASVLKSQEFDDEQEMQRIAELIENSGENLLKLVNSLLDLYRFESGQLDVELVDVELNDLINEVVNKYYRLAEQKDLELQVEPLPHSLYGRLDPSKMDQVLSNLISNAIKFTPKKGRISIDLALKGSESDPDGFEITVHDTGIGIPEDTLPTIFQKFGKHQRSGTDKEKGIGLGLSIVKNFVELQKGSVEVQSKKDEGTTFTLHFNKEAISG